MLQMRHDGGGGGEAGRHLLFSYEVLGFGFWTGDF